MKQNKPFAICCFSSKPWVGFLLTAPQHGNVWHQCSVISAARLLLFQIEVKVLTLTYKALNGFGLSYLIFSFCQLWPAELPQMPYYEGSVSLRMPEGWHKPLTPRYFPEPWACKKLVKQQGISSGSCHKPDAPLKEDQGIKKFSPGSSKHQLSSSVEGVLTT